jgi:hypothetical protein
MRDVRGLIQEVPMASGEIAYLSMAIAAFVVFMIVLGTVEFVERRKLRKPAPKLRAVEQFPPDAWAHHA